MFHPPSFPDWYYSTTYSTLMFPTLRYMIRKCETHQYIGNATKSTAKGKGTHPLLLSNKHALNEEH